MEGPGTAHDAPLGTRATASGRRVAVIGSGVSGLVAAWQLREHAHVTLYEADDRLGGHAHTHELTDSTGRQVHVDSGFIVHNRRTYPVLLQVFAELGIATQPTEMSMSVRCEGCGLEYAGARGLAGLLTGLGNLRPRYLRMLTEIGRFHRLARALLSTEDEITLAEFLARHRFSDYMAAHYITPVVASVWSCAPRTAREYPARYLFTFLEHHGLLEVRGAPQWLTVTGGSYRYVEAIAAQVHEVLLRTPVAGLRRTAAGVEVTDGRGDRRTYDAAVVATHPDQALAMLAEPTADEREVLGAIGYSVNETVLHRGADRVLPRSPRAHGAWNYRLSACDADPAGVRVSYDMNRLQRLDTPDRFVVSLNSADLLDEGDVIARMVYAHPVYTPASRTAQQRLRDLDDDRVVFAGAYHGWGFHEDGARAGRDAAAGLVGGW